MLAPSSTFETSPPDGPAACLARIGLPLGHELLGPRDQLGAVGDALLHADVDRGLAGEAADVLDGQVMGEDHGVGRSDVRGGDRLRARGALGLHDDGVPGGLGGVLEALGGHVGVGDSRRARRDTDETQAASGGRGRGGGG